jgi:hypothetical protein
LNRKRNRVAVIILLAAVASLAFALLAMGQTGGSHDLSWSVIAGGGGESSGAGYVIKDTLGQPAIDGEAGKGDTLTDGFWQAISVHARVYLPVVIRQP